MLQSIGRTCTAALLILLAFVSVYAQRATDRGALSLLAEEFQQQLEARQGPLYYRLLNSTDPGARALNRSPDITLMFIGDDGMPVYYAARNLNAARTIGTDRVWPGGDTGHNLSGSGTAPGQLGIWDVGGVLTDHPEFGGRVTHQDKPGKVHYHATAVAGTMVAAGIDSAARGMSYEAVLTAYDHTNDNTEMVKAAAAGMIVSNHSYGPVAGWRKDEGSWYWYGLVELNSVEDYKHGFYSAGDRGWDLISYYAPHYLIVVAAGNDRNDSGPEQGGRHYHWDQEEGWVLSWDRHRPDGAEGGYDTLPGYSNAKNVLSVGAVNDIPGGYTEPADVVQSTFSSWGPTDDGRIKPDIVANGVALRTASSDSTAPYDTLYGTSFATPCVTGSANLLAGQYKAVYGDFPLAATLKAVILFGADEAGGHDGPDYSNGWGLMNTASSADVIAASDRIVESTLVNHETETFEFTVDTGGHVRVTAVWMDRAGPLLAPAVDARTRVLVNDLDIRVEHIATRTVHLPWALDFRDPAAPAQQRDNNVDNVEQIDIEDAAPGRYRVVVTHKGSLAGEQAYSLVASRPLTPFVVAAHNARWNSGSVEIAWTMGSAGSYTYAVARSRAPDGPFVDLPMTAQQTGDDVLYHDGSADLGTSYTYRVSIFQNSATLFEFQETITTPPHPFFVTQNYPNPFVDETRIDYSLDQRATVSLRVYDVSGRLVRVLVEGERSRGRHTELWDGRDDAGARIATGVYFFRMVTGGQTFVRKVMCVR